MGHKARDKRIDRRTASTDAIVRQGAETLALVAATQAKLVERSLEREQMLREREQMLRESGQLLEKVNATSERSHRRSRISASPSTSGTCARRR